MPRLLRRLREKLSAAALALGTIEEQAALAVVLGLSTMWNTRSVDGYVIDAWVALGGITFAVEVAIAISLLGIAYPMNCTRVYAVVMIATHAN